MPRFPFKEESERNKNIKKDMEIFLDGINYFDKKVYNEVKKIEYSSKNGKIIIDGLFDLSNKDILNLIKVNFLSVLFSKELKKSFKLQFDNPKISLSLNLSKDSIDIIKNNINKLKMKYKNFDTDYKNYIVFSLSNFNNVNILEYLQKEEEEKEEEIKVIEAEEEEKEEEDIFNPFLQKFEKKDEKSEIIEQKDNFEKKFNYIKANNFDNLHFPLDKKINNKIINKYIPKNIQKLKDKISNNYFLTMNNNSIFPFLKINENKKQTFELKSIPFNDELKDLKQNYVNDILLNFITLLNANNYNDPENNMTINDYTYIVLSFIKNLENKILDIKKNNDINVDKKYNFYIQRLEKISSSLKLFHILFLNCFITNENINIINNENLFDDYTSLKVQTMRKKMLIEWCLKEEKNYIKKNDLINTNKTLKKNILSKQIISFGQIKTAIISNDNKNIFMNAKLSNLSKDNCNNTFTYFIKKQKNNNDSLSKSFISYESFKNNDKIKNNWISFFLQSLLFIENSNDYILKSIQIIDEKIKDMDDISNPYITIKNINEKEVFQINYLLLKIYEKIMKDKDNNNLDINNILNYINMFSKNNLFNLSNSDHFVQYIIFYLFTKIINIHFKNLKNYSILNKKLYLLLCLIISEILSNNTNNNKNIEIFNIILIIKLLHYSNINKKLKQKIFIDIITHENLESIQTFWDTYDNDINNENINIDFINDEIKYYINGIYYSNKCNWNEAYKCFLKCKKYDYCMNAYINYFFSLINEDNINNINFEEINNNFCKEEFTILNDLYGDLKLIITFIVNEDKSNYEEIIQILAKYIEQYNNNNKININEKNHRLIIKLICHALFLKNKKDEELILGGDNSFFELNNTLFKDKKNLLNDILKDIIEHKNIQYSFK